MTSAPAALSPVATTVQQGTFFQAGAPDGSENASSAAGRWVAAISAAWAAGRSAANAARNFAGLIVNSVAVCDPFPVGYWSGTNASFRTLSFDVLSTSPRSLSVFGREGRDEDEADDVLGLGGGVAEHRAAVRVPDGKHGAGNLLEHARDVGGVDGDAAQWVRGRDHLHAVGQESFGYAIPARGVGERAVHENNGQSFGGGVRLGHGSSLGEVRRAVDERRQRLADLDDVRGQHLARLGADVECVVRRAR